MVAAVHIDIFKDRVWQMSLGERAAVEGVLSQLKPSVAIEIGSMEGACLRRLAAHATEVHSLDLRPPNLPVPANVTVHTGDSHVLLPQLLRQLSDEGRNVDLAIVDGDHSAGGVRQDIEDLLNSRALARGLILVHDTANETVRQGLDAVHFTAWPKVAHVELDWIPGQLFADEGLQNELWYGLGLIVVDVGRASLEDGSVYERRYHPAAPLLAQARDLTLARQLPEQGRPVQGGVEAAETRVKALEAELTTLISERRRIELLEAELEEVARRADALQAEIDASQTLEGEFATLRHRYEGAQRAIENITSSASWRMTEPLRNAKRLVRPRSD